MKPAARLHPGPDPAALARGFARAGVGLFGLRRLPAPSSLFRDLAEGFDPGRALGGAPLAWPEACAALAGRMPGLLGPLGQLLLDFRLELHEWFLLALAGEVETDHDLVLAVAELQAPERTPRPALHLASALCAELFGARASPLALAQGALASARVWRVSGEGPLPLRTLEVAPRLWAALTGDGAPWPGCSVLPADPPELVPASLRADLGAIAELVAQGAARAVVLRGTPDTAELTAAHLAAALGLTAVRVPEALWADEPALPVACRYAGWLPVLAPRLGPGEPFRLAAAAARWGPVAVVLGTAGAVEAPGLLEVEVPPLPLPERLAVWRASLGDAVPVEWAETALLDGPAIRRVAERAQLDARRRDEPLGAGHVARARRRLGADRLRLLAQPLPHRVGPEALVLPPALARQFDDLVTRCRRREGLWEGLGATLAASRSTGVRALLSGESGTGKTLAAGRLATLLGAPLYRVDLAAVMNKYVGESEKNLGLVLDDAAACDVILLLDEADALFGRRSDGGETGERYANMLTNFLLTRIESHPGIVLLTTNSRTRIDPAFTRRLDAVLEFPLPAVEERLRLWHSHLGSRAPGGDLCRVLAAYCDLPGGFIRNAVLSAAARSPSPPAEPLEPELLVAALREEYRKLGRNFPPHLEPLKG